MSYTDTSGGTLTLPSPTHAHHVDVGSAVRSLRRSLSRSPSKFGLARTASQGSDSLEPSHRATQLDSHSSGPETRHNIATTPASGSSSINTPQQTPFATPFRSSVKLSLRSARPKLTSKPLMRTRLSPRSPLKRALSIVPDSGNAAPLSPAATEPLLGQENNTFNSFARALSATPLANLDKPSRHSVHLDLSGASKSTSARFLEAGRDPLPSLTLSPLKRSDAIMDSDLTGLGSPVPKRRSLHGISSLTNDSSIFDHAPSAQATFDIHDDNLQEYQLTGSATPVYREPVPSPTPSSALPRRSSSLRKSTLQQRHDPRSSWGRRQGEKYLAQQSSETTSPVPRNRPRASLDQILRPEPRDSPFTMRGPLPNPSVHLFERGAHQPHPLSRSLTTSSSSSSLPDDSPTHFPIQNPDRPRHTSIFGKSLPIGAHRPREAVATPQYKLAKPLQAAFASTGLVSKMNRNPELDPALQGGKPMIMPDTPCKKQVYPSNTYPPSSGSGRKQQRFSFPVPETPFTDALQPPRGTFGTSDKIGGLFKVKSGSHMRKTSLLSFDGDGAEGQGVDGDLPLTPTKSVLAKNLFAGGVVHQTPITSRTFAPPTSAIGPGVDRRQSDSSSSPLGRTWRKSDSPKTPQETIAPPDPSRLSISNSQESQASESKRADYPPATPTTGRAEIVPGFGGRVSVTPVHGRDVGDVDDALRYRFEKVERVGRGEFSQVYRVTKTSYAASFPDFGVTPSRRPAASNGVERVYAVKKLRLPILGQKDRAAKLREVTALQAVRGCDNVLQIIDHWEQGSQLYIQTEFCDEGGLDSFLKRVGEFGRLDDFRIWKILLEVCQVSVIVPFAISPLHLVTSNLLTYC